MSSPCFRLISISSFSRSGQYPPFRSFSERRVAPSISTLALTGTGYSPRTTNTSKLLRAQVIPHGDRHAPRSDATQPTSYRVAEQMPYAPLWILRLPHYALYSGRLGSGDTVLQIRPRSSTH